MCACAPFACLAHEGARRGHWTSQNCSYRHLCATSWALSIKPECYGRAASTFHHGVISWPLQVLKYIRCRFLKSPR